MRSDDEGRTAWRDEMFCANARKLMTRRHHEALAPAEELRLSRHLARCPACRAEFEADATFEAALRRRIGEGALRPPAARIAPDRIMQQIRRARRGTADEQRRWLRLAAGSAAVGLAAYAAVALRPSPRQMLPGHSVAGPAVGRSLAGGPSPAPVIQEGHRTPGQSRGSVSTSAQPPARVPPRRWNARLTLPETHPKRAFLPAGSSAAMVADDQYLDGRDACEMAVGLAGNRHDAGAHTWLAQLPRVQDDFVHIPLPLLASADAKSPVVGQALRKYEQEAKVVDTRLFRKITLSLKGNSLEEFCQAFDRETGVRIRPSRGVADEKVTVFVKGVAARDVMRAVARLFGFFWSRSGEEGTYRYELFQDLKSQLAEEEMRNRDQDGAILAIDTAMQHYLRELDLPLEELRKKADQASGAEKDRLNTLLHGGWGMAKVYRHLAPADLAALLRGEALHFSTTSPNPQRKLPDEWRQMLFETGRQRELDPNTRQFVEVGELPDALSIVSLRLKRSELGQVSLEGSAGVYSPSTRLGGGTPRTLAVGRSPATASPENAVSNRELQSKVPFSSIVTFRPEPHCANLKRWFAFGTTFGSGTPNSGAMEAPQAHVDSAEVWEEVHRRSGLPIVADYYTRQFDLGQMTAERVPLFEALCRVGDRMGVRWRKDGAFLLCRSSSYFWDKLKEVPNRQIRRWQADVREGKGLPLRDLLEIASLSDQQLNSAVTAPGMRQCYGIEEWDTVGGDTQRPLRAYARFLSLLVPAQLEAALSPGGLPLARLTPPQLQEWLRLQPASPPEAHLRVEYAPAGSYVWVPVAPRAVALRLVDLDMVAGTNPDEVLARARRHYPDASARQIRRSTGVLAIRLGTREKELFQLGRPPILQAD